MNRNLKSVKTSNEGASPNLVRLL